MVTTAQRVRRAAATKTTYVYVLALRGGRFYVGATVDPKGRIAAHRNGLGASWTKRNPVEKVVSVREGGYGDEARVTVEMMRAHGVDAVRGGPWVSTKPMARGPWEEPNFAETMRRAEANACLNCGALTHWTARCAASAARKRRRMAASAASDPKPTRKRTKRG